MDALIYKRILLTPLFGVVASMMLMTSAFAAETPAPVEKEPIVEAIKSINTHQSQLETNNDAERRNALEKTFNIKLDETDVWEDKEGQYSYDANGVKHNYTPHKVEKALGFYAVNANLQELILYGKRTDNWQPYRMLQAQETPAYFQLVDGKLEYSKAFFGHEIEMKLFSFGEKISNNLHNPEKRTELEAEKKAFLEKYAALFKAAPGEVPHVVGLNHTEELAKQYDVPQVDKDFFNSKFNDPDVMNKGTYKDGSNPFKK